MGEGKRTKVRRVLALAASLPLVGASAWVWNDRQGTNAVNRHVDSLNATKQGLAAAASGDEAGVDRHIAAMRAAIEDEGGLRSAPIRVLTRGALEDKACEVLLEAAATSALLSLLKGDAAGGREGIEAFKAAERGARRKDPRNAARVAAMEAVLLDPVAARMQPHELRAAVILGLGRAAAGK